MYCLLKDEMLKRYEKSNFMTVPKALKELETIERCVSAMASTISITCYNRNPEGLLSAFGMNGDDFAKATGEALKALQSEKKELQDCIIMEMFVKKRQEHG